MHFAATAPLLLALSTAVSAGCYTGGIASTAADVEMLTANDFSALRLACSGMTTGSFQHSQESQFCLTTADNNNKWNFYIQRISDSPQWMFLSVDDCIDGLQKEVTGCGYGGDSSYTNWRFSSDINAGSHC